MRGRNQEQAALMGWPDEYQADLGPDVLHRQAGQLPPPWPEQARDPQEGSWEE